MKLKICWIQVVFRIEAAENIPQRKVASPSELIAGPIPDKVQLLIKSFECPITQDLMKDPVICILDGRTYENEYITKWLTEHRYSPLTREQMTSNQKVSDVLKPNRALADAIEGFRVEHPELFKNNPEADKILMEQIHEKMPALFNIVTKEELNSHMQFQFS